MGMAFISYCRWGKAEVVEAKGKRRKPGKPGAAFIRQQSDSDMPFDKTSKSARILSKLQIYSETRRVRAAQESILERPMEQNSWNHKLTR